MKTIDEIMNSARRPVVIAHRGASFYHRENTMEAFEAAVKMRAEMVELDVRRTRDGVLVVHHDRDFEKTEIQEMTIDQIRERCGSAGYTIPTLVEVLQFCKDKITVDIEIKEPGYEEQVAGTALDILEADRLLFSSSYDIAALEVKARHPEVKTGLILHRAFFPGLLRHLLPAARIRAAGADFAMVSEKLLKVGFLGLNKRLGKPVWVYTVNDRKRLWDLMADERIGGVFTDRPDVALFMKELHTLNQNSESGIQETD